MPGWLALVLLVTPVLIVAVLGTREVRSAERGRRITTVPDGWLPARGVVVDERVSRRGGNGPAGGGVGRSSRFSPSTDAR